MTDIILKAEGLKKNYGNLEILKGIDFEIHRGESCSIVGKSGSGKSTLLNVLALLDKKDGGRILYNGIDSDSFKEKERVSLRRNTISFVFQNSLLFEDFSALENIMISLSIAGVGKKEAKEKAEALLKSVGLFERRSHRPKELSGGERQRVAIARAISNDADLLFLDEPTGSLDEDAKANVEELLFSGMITQNSSLIIVTHDMDLSSKAERCYVLRGGLLERL